MQDMRFDPPRSAVADIVVEDGRRVPEDVLKKIRNAWIAALVSAAVTLVIALVAMAGELHGPFSGSQLWDVVFILGLAFGISRKSRVCAVVMFLYFVISKIWLIYVTGQFNGIYLGFAFLYFYGQGAMATFDYHRIRKS